MGYFSPGSSRRFWRETVERQEGSDGRAPVLAKPEESVRLRVCGVDECSRVSDDPTHLRLPHAEVREDHVVATAFLEGTPAEYEALIIAMKERARREVQAEREQAVDRPVMAPCKP